MYLSEIYKRTLLDAETPRRGDVCEVIRDHHGDETGLIVVVVNDPHYCVNTCADCGQEIKGYFVEVQSDNPKFKETPGPHFYPLAWLKRRNT